MSNPASLLLAALTLIVAPSSAHAIHAYASHECTAEKVDLRYDGPGSNYAACGLYRFYSNASRDSAGDPLKILANRQKGKCDDPLGEVIGDWGTVGVVFTFAEDTRVPGTDTREGPVAGAACEPDEWDFVTEGYDADSRVRVDGITKEAASALNLIGGEMLAMKCRHTLSIPFRCPASGTWDLE